MRDLSQEAWLSKRELQDRLVELISGHGYHFLDTPILEPTDLFLRKSGGELASRMYSFTDASSNQVSLRPEFTSSIMRYYLEHAHTIDLPARWQYAGPVFRYQDAEQASHDPPVSPAIGATSAKGGSLLRGLQFTQVGAELVGSAGVIADAELVGLALTVTSHVGLSDCWLELGDLDVLHSVLDAVGVSERARTFIIGSVPQLRKGRPALPALVERAQQLHLATPSSSLRQRGEETRGDYLSEAIHGLGDTEARKVLRGLLQWTAVDQMGQRDPDEVVERLLRKLRGRDDIGTLQRGLELIADLSLIHGEPDAAIDAARTVVHQAGADPAALERLAQLIGLLDASPCPVTGEGQDGDEIPRTGVLEYSSGVLSRKGRGGGVRLDFGLARGLAYYNGIIFEVKHPAWPSFLGGGGRYDGLARALGSPETVPALGFAYTLETLLALTGGG